MENQNKNIIAKFSAYVRKPVGVNDGGNKAMFYAYAGDSANTICSFSTTFYWGQTVNVNVYLIKDRLGVLMNENGQYPLIASFIGRIEHPLHKNNDGGQTAVFYAESGKNGDIVSKFMQDQYNDALVYIELRGMLSIDSPEIYEAQAQKEIEENHKFNLSESERKEYQKYANKFYDLNLEFQNFALSNPKVLKLIEEEVENNEYLSYEQWLKNVYLNDDFRNNGIDNQCYHPRCNNILHHEDIYKVSDNKYHYYCLCPNHQHDMHTMDDKLIDYFASKSAQNKRRWIWHYFVSNFAFSNKHHPDSRKIYRWLEQNDLLELASKKFVKGVLMLLN